MKLIALVLTFIAPLASFANSPQGGHEIKWDEHTRQIVIYQTINFTILVVMLFFLLKSKVRIFFQDKKTVYEKAAEKAKSAQVAAETEFMELRVQLEKLQSTTEESLSRARAEAAELKQQLIREAKETSERLKHEAQETVIVEVEKAKNHIKNQLIAESIKLARTQITTTVSKEDHQRLQSDFIDNIKGAQA